MSVTDSDVIEELNNLELPVHSVTGLPKTKVPEVEIQLLNNPRA